MRLGAVLVKERERAGLSANDMASRLLLSDEDYRSLESGTSDAEQWGPTLASIAVELRTPASRLLSPTGRASEAQPGQIGQLIRDHRLRRGRSPEDVAQAVGLTAESYLAIEAGTSMLEEAGPQLLRFADAVGQPIFNLLYPCGLPLKDIADYPVDP